MFVSASTSFKGIASRFNEQQEGTQNRGQAVIWAARDRDLDGLRVLLDHPEGISEEDRGQAVIAASARNPDNLEALQLLLHNQAQISPAARGEAVKYTARTGDLSMLRFLLENEAVISPEDRSQALIDAIMLCEGGLSYTKTTGPYYMEDLNHTAELIKCLLEGQKEISSEAKGVALERVAYHDNQNAFAVLIDHPAPLPLVHRSQAVLCTAAKRNHIEQLRKLIAAGPEMIPTDQIGLAVIEVAKMSDPDMLQCLLDYQPNILHGHRSLAIVAAAIRGSRRLVELLLAGFEISTELRGWAVMQAAMGGYLNVVQVLLADGDILPEDRGEAARRSAWTPKNLAVLELLLQDQITEADRAGVLRRSAATEGGANIGVSQERMNAFRSKVQELIDHNRKRFPDSNRIEQASPLLPTAIEIPKSEHIDPEEKELLGLAESSTSLAGNIVETTHRLQAQAALAAVPAATAFLPQDLLPPWAERLILAASDNARLNQVEQIEQELQRLQEAEPAHLPLDVNVCQAAIRLTTSPRVAYRLASAANWGYLDRFWAVGIALFNAVRSFFIV